MKNLTVKCFSRILTRVALAVIWVYRYFFSPWLGQRCRFYPTCSCYAREALERYGFWFGLWLTLKRILRCHPFCKGGVDLIPEKNVH